MVRAGTHNDAISKGTNSLIRDGANPLIDIDDFMGRITGKYGQLLLEFGDDSPAPRLSENLSEKEKLILGLLQRKGNRTLDDIMEESGLDFVGAQSCLATLCAAGLAYESGPGRYSAGL
jgi:DNA processing protein